MEFIKNKKMLISLILIISIFMIMSFFWIKKTTYSMLETDDINSITLQCPNVAGAGENIECMVYANISSKNNVYAINANFKFAKEITYDKFLLPDSNNENEQFKIYSTTDKGFALVNINGFKGKILLGYLDLNLSNNAIAGREYNIELENIEYTYGDVNNESSSIQYLIRNIDNSLTNVRIKSDIATLDDISINGFDIVKINESEKENLIEYSSDVNIDTSNILVSFTKTDVNSISNGNGSLGIPINLHYGTNNIEVEITSENGLNNKMYRIYVKRPYKFETKVYKYDEVNKKLYVGNDNNSEILNLLEKSEPNIRYEINDKNNKLNIYYLDELIDDTIELLRFDSAYEIIEDKIFIEKDLTYYTLIDKIKSDKLTIKIYDSKNNEVQQNGTVINENNILVVLDENGNPIKDEFGKQLYVYHFVIEYLRFNDNLNVDNNLKLFKRLKIGTKYDDLLLNINTSGKISITDRNGENLTTENIIKTGDKITIHMSNDDLVYTMSVLGDITGDGIIEINDIDKLYRYYKNDKISSIDYCESDAGNIVEDGKIEINDVDKLYRYYKGNIKSLEG